MRIAVVSDTHFGDDLCTLVQPGPPGCEPEPGPGYAALRAAIGRVDYLVLLGDIIDLSVGGYEEAFRDARAFFTALQRDGVARELVYVPGNHDFDIWNVVEHQVSVINQLKQGELPRPFKRAVPGVIDAREEEPRLHLPDVAAHPEWHSARTDYGGLFLDHITLRPSPPDGPRGLGERLVFDFAYPNLYLVTEDGESVLLTHGHYFEAFWTLLGEWAVRLAADDLPHEHPGELSVRELVGVNFPLHQLACSGIGQAQPLTALARRVQLDFGAGRTDRVARYLERLEAVVAGRSVPLLERLVRRWIARRARARIVAALADAEQTRFSRSFLSRPAVRERFRRYYRSCLAELDRLRREHGVDVPPPRHVVFGHTHQPIPWDSGELADSVDGHEVVFCNTGGWVLQAPGAVGSYAGAEVVLYETGRGMRSTSIRPSDLSAAVREVGAPSRE
jgi:UDP-2,3-diacylglucosamine pyrophosphatase LpxH